MKDLHNTIIEACAQAVDEEFRHFSKGARAGAANADAEIDHARELYEAWRRSPERDAIHRALKDDLRAFIARQPETA